MPVMSVDTPTGECRIPLSRLANAISTLIVEASPGAMLLVGGDGKIVAANRMAEELFGYMSNEMAGLQLEQLLPERFRSAHPANRLAFFHQPKERAMGIGRELSALRKNGVEFPVEIGLNPVDASSNPLVLCSIADITERKKSEMLFRSVVEACPTAMLMVDTQGRIALVNALAERTFGYSRQELIGSAVDILVPERFRKHHQEHRATFFACPQTRAMGQGRDLYCVRKDGSEFPIEIGLSPVETAGGGYVLSSIVDITERKRQELALQDSVKQISEAKERAEAATTAKSLFLASMSHEIRTPMNGILGMSQLLLDTAMTAEQREFVEIINRSGEGLLGIINDILDFSKIEAGKLELESVNFDLRELLETSVDLLAGKADEKGITIRTLIDPAVPVALRGDPGRLRQVLVNLLANAVKFTQKGEVQIHLFPREAQERESGPVLRFEVRDTGIGISQEAQSRLFQAFTQADNSTTRKFGGSGLGLSISKRFVEKMGGTIGVDSLPEKGSTFWLEIPLVEGDFCVMNWRSSIGDRRVLIVEDEEVDRKVLRYQLSRAGLSYAEAKTPEAALAELLEAAAAGTPFDAAVIDYLMPEMDGVTLGEKILAHPELSGLPLFLLTGYGGVEIGRRALMSGFRGYLTKPLRESVMMKLLNEAFGVSAPPVTISKGRRETAVIAQRILVAEDNAINQRLLAKVLAKMGHIADIVPNGRMAVEALRHTNYDIVLMDCCMPEMDGFEATEQIRRPGNAWSRVPIIALTANAMKGDSTRCLEAGMDAYLSKPIDLALLNQAIHRFAVSKSKTPDVAPVPDLELPEIQK
jgi:two-component system, sensor histidine kinase and response regulator